MDEEEKRRIRENIITLLREKGCTIVESNYVNNHYLVTDHISILE